jgi:hypothetical protein
MIAPQERQKTFTAPIGSSAGYLSPNGQQMHRRGNVAVTHRIARPRRVSRSTGPDGAEPANDG